MAKILKKALAVTASAAIAASVITVPVIADAADATISYSEGKATATQSGKLIAASYNEDKTLASVKLYDATANTPVDVEVSEGDKLMLWDGVDGETMKPLADVYEVPAAAVETQAPATEAPATEAPAPETQAPATEAPATEAPATEAPDDVKVIKSWKFDFGSTEDVADGFTAVTADVNYTLNNAGEDQYGFIGTNENDYKLNGGRMDGFNQQEGQVITLSNGGGTGLNDAIGSTGEDAFGNAGDKFYPARFALKAQDEQYFRVKAYVTTLDNTKDAKASLYTERKHPLYTEKTIRAGETEVTEFTVRTTPIYYEKSDPKGSIKDEMVNIALLGENTALAALEIDQIETAPVLWVLGDSTVTDGGGTLPFWPLQNYTGVGTGLTKYLPKNIAMVNEGEGGLAANDNNHFNMVKNRIKAGDYMYVEYGHNHKSDGVDGYKSYLDKYYNACKEVGATLILVGPIDRHNDSQYNSAENKWSSTLGGYSAAAKAYVDVKIAAGATDIAFVDLNKPSLDWYTELTKGGIVAGTEYTNNIKLTNYYFMTAKGGGTDGTHPNDAGAENLAYFFFSTADTDAYPALAPLMTRYKAGQAETPNPVPQYVLDAGWASNSTWPQYMPPVVFEYPIVVQRVAANDDGIIELTAKVQMGFANYASGVLEVYNEDGQLDKKYVTVDHIDNTTGNGINTLHFAKEVTIGENKTYKAYIWSCYLDKEELIPEEEGGEQLSAVYEPTDIAAYIVPGEGGEKETFDYYGKAALTDVTKYVFGGSAGHDLTFGSDSETTYVRIMSDGAKNGASGQGSFYIMRPFENLDGGTGTTGRYMIDVDLKYVSGGGMNFGFAKSTTPNKSPFISESFTAFSVGGSGNVTVSGASEPVGAISATAWTNVKYIIDMNAGEATISVAGGTPVVVPVDRYKTFGTPSPDTLRHFIIEGQKVAFDVLVSNMTVAKLADSKEKTTIKVSVASDNTGMGTVYVNEAGTTEATVTQSTVVKAAAVPAEGYVFTGWLRDGAAFSDEAELDIRLFEDLDLTAAFAKQAGVDGIVNYALDSDKALVKAADGATANISVKDVVDKSGNPVAYTDADITWACTETGVTVDNGVVTFGTDFAIDANATKDVTVTATLNGIERSYVLTAYSYQFYETVKNGKVSSGTWNGDIAVIANTNGIAFPAGGSTYTYNIAAPVTLDTAATIEYTAAGGGSDNKACGQPRYIEIYDSKGTKVVNEVIGYSWQKLAVGGSIGGSDITGGTDFANAFALGSWSSPVIITINTDGTGKVSFNGTSADITINTAATDIASIKFISKSGAPGYTARALALTDLKITK